MDLNLAILAFALMTVGNYWIARSVLYPPFIFCTMFLLELSIYRAGIIDMDPLHANTLLFISGGAFVFSLGGVLSRCIPERVMAIRFRLTSLPLRNKGPKYALLALLILSFPLIVRDRVQKAAQGTGDSFMERARNGINEQAEEGRRSSDYLVNSIPPIANLAVLLFMIEDSGPTFWCATAIAVLYCLSGGGRTDLLTLIAATTGIRLIRSRRETFTTAFKFIKWPVSIFVVFFVAFVYVSKNTNSYSSLTDVISYFLVGYLISPTAALDRVVQHPGDFLGSNHTFQFFLKPLAALSLTPYTPPPVLDQFIYVPMPANVYTVYRFYLTDFGFAGALICIGIIGLLHSTLYRRAQREKSRLSLILFGLSLFAVIMASFDDHYYEIGSYIRISGICIVYWLLSSLNLRWLSIAKSPFRLSRANASLSR